MVGGFRSLTWLELLEGICHYARAITGRRKAWFHLRIGTICSETQVDDIAYEQTIISRQLFAGHVVGSQPMKRKKNFLRNIIIFSLINSVGVCFADFSDR